MLDQMQHQENHMIRAAQRPITPIRSFDLNGRFPHKFSAIHPAEPHVLHDLVIEHDVQLHAAQLRMTAHIVVTLCPAMLHPKALRLHEHTGALFVLWLDQQIRIARHAAVRRRVAIRQRVTLDEQRRDSRRIHFRQQPQRRALPCVVGKSCLAHLADQPFAQLGRTIKRGRQAQPIAQQRLHRLLVGQRLYLFPVQPLRYL